MKVWIYRRGHELAVFVSSRGGSASLVRRQVRSANRMHVPPAKAFREGRVPRATLSFPWLETFERLID